MILRQRFLGAFLALIIPLYSASAQTQEQLAQLEPKDLFFQGWMLARDAERLIKKDKFLDAYAKLQKAKVMFDTIAVNHATYEPNLVEFRQGSTRKSMETIYNKAEAEQAAKEKKSGAFIEGGGPSKLAPLNPTLEQKRDQDLQDAQRQIDQLKQSLAGALNNRDAESAKMRQALKDLETERNRVAAAPLKSEMDALNEQIADLKRERQAMSLALSKTRSDLALTKQKLDVSQKAYVASQKKVRELTAVVEEQSKINSRVVKGQQDQIDELRREMKRKDQLMAQANQQIQDLSTQLEQSHNLVGDLQNERDALVQERNEMATLLELSEANRVQKLLGQNLSLHQKFKEANLKVEAMTKNTDATKEDITLARRGLVVAKAKIREAQRDNTKQKLRIRDLEKRLEMAENDIITRAENGDLSEAQHDELLILRNLAKEKRNQLKAQQKKGELLLAQAERMGVKDPEWADAVNQFKGTLKISLTADEEAIIDNATADYTANSQFQPSAVERRRAAQELSRRTGYMKKVAIRLVEREDMQAARGILSMVIEEDPGSWDAMINLGIVNLRMDNPDEAAKQFNQAILYAGDRKIPLAHSFLGEAFYRTELYDDARRELNLSLTMEPENSDAHVLLGNMAGKTSNLMDAEVHYQEAIRIDPSIWEPHYNLAFLCSLNGRKTQGKIHYQEALRRGAPANLKLEEKLDF